MGTLTTDTFNFHSKHTHPLPVHRLSDQTAHPEGLLQGLYAPPTLTLSNRPTWPVLLATRRLERVWGRASNTLLLTLRPGGQ